MGQCWIILNRKMVQSYLAKKFIKKNSMIPVTISLLSFNTMEYLQYKNHKLKHESGFILLLKENTTNQVYLELKEVLIFN